MRTIITVQKCPRTNGYEISVKRPNTRPNRGERSGTCPSGAAASAIDKAMGCDEFLIISPAEVSAYIPKEFGGRA